MSARRILAFAAGGGLFVGVIGVGIVSGVAIQATGTSFEPAQAGESTYTVQDAAIEYPYVAPGPMETKPDPTNAGVSFTTSWSTGTYPGKVQCLITLTDASGQVVGQTTTGVD
jgi:hypothetical protein